MSAALSMQINDIRPSESTGTPKTLTQAIARGMRGSEALMTDDVAEDTAPAVLDWLSQRFTAAMMTRDPSVLDAMEKLWASIKEGA